MRKFGFSGATQGRYNEDEPAEQGPAIRPLLKGRTPVQEEPAFPPKLVMSLSALTLVFGCPLWDWSKFAVHSDLYSHVLLIPLISLYLAWPKIKYSAPDSLPNRARGLLWLFAGAATSGIYGILVFSGRSYETQDYVAFLTLSFVLCMVGVCEIYLGRDKVRSLAFPLVFLGFMIPLPLALERLFDHVLQSGSAAVALGIFKLLGTPVFYTNLVFKLPGIALQVAPECSGIHSSLVLLIISVLAGFFFLRSPGKRAVLVLATFPLAVIRNGIRIVTIGELCVRLGPEMINSDIHRRGGPLFFTLSLLPFSTLLWWLWRSEQRNLTPIALIEE